MRSSPEAPGKGPLVLGLCQSVGRNSVGLGAGCILVLWVEMEAVKETRHLALYGGRETGRELQGKGVQLQSEESAEVG